MIVFLQCAAGHDLTAEDAFIYRSNGSRDCRLCAFGKGGPHRPRRDLDRRM